MADPNDREGDDVGDQCPTPEALRRFGVGDLPRSEREGVARHVEGCPACASAMESLGDPADTLAVVGP